LGELHVILASPTVDEAFSPQMASTEDVLSRIGVIEPGMIGLMRPHRVAPKRNFEWFQECGFLPDFAMTFSPFSGIGLGLWKLSPSRTIR
jgi:hypothetical protein